MCMFTNYTAVDPPGVRDQRAAPQQRGVGRARPLQEVGHRRYVCAYCVRAYYVHIVYVWVYMFA